jgi:predicted transcriptional regulator
MDTPASAPGQGLDTSRDKRLHYRVGDRTHDQIEQLAHGLKLARVEVVRRAVQRMVDHHAAELADEPDG